VSARPLWSPRRAFSSMFVSVLLVQLAWALAVPAFRGLDEFDHAYKAAAVARGQLHDAGPTRAGDGRLVSVPRDLVAAARDACRSRPYTGHDSCRPVGTQTDGLVTVDSSAAAYNPAYYAVVGTVALKFSGAWALVAMRGATILLCALMLGWAAAVTARWARTGWPFVTMAVGLTPVLLYSTTIVSPNGLQYAGAVLVWSSMLGLVDDQHSARRFLPALTAGAAVTVATHTTGPLWLLLIALTVFLLEPLRGWVGRVRSDPRAWVASAGLIGAATAACAFWVRHARTNALGAPDESMPALTVTDLLREVLLWVLQTVGAFPMRDEAAAPVTYVVWMLVFLGLAGLFFRRASSRQRWVQVLLALACLVVPLALTLIAYSSLGLAWQGRYGLPLSVGMPLLIGWALSQRGVGLPPRVAGTVLAALGVASAFAVVQVARHETALAPHPPLADHLPLGLVLVGALAVIAPLVMLRLLTARGVAAPGSAPARHVEPVAS
jgi:hypothetical protein